MRPNLRTHQNDSTGHNANPPHSSYYVFQKSFDDFDELAECAQDWNIEFRQIDHGRFTGSFAQIVGAEAQVGRASMGRTLQRNGVTPPSLHTFIIHLDEALNHSLRGSQINGGELVILPPNAELAGVSRPGFDAFILSLGESVLTDVAETVGRPDLLAKFGQTRLLDVPTPALDALRNHLCTFQKELGLSGDAATESYVDRQLKFELPRRLLRALAASQPPNRRPLYRVRERALQQALDFLEDTVDRAPSVRELCQATDASERTLQQAFRERFGVTPGAYLRAIRLNGARKDLRRADPTSSRVSDVANAWGFWHMGQFAADYRRQFDELPSETLVLR